MQSSYFWKPHNTFSRCKIVKRTTSICLSCSTQVCALSFGAQISKFVPNSIIKIHTFSHRFEFFGFENVLRSKLKFETSHAQMSAFQRSLAQKWNLESNSKYLMRRSILSNARFSLMICLQMKPNSGQLRISSSNWSMIAAATAVVEFANVAHTTSSIDSCLWFVWNGIPLPSTPLFYVSQVAWCECHRIPPANDYG